jgi:predicted DNA-binding transcriptional regulator AlpA
MDDELWTVDDLADFLKIPKATIYNWNYLRVGPQPMKVGRRLRWWRSEVIAWVNEQRVPPWPG